MSKMTQTFKDAKAQAIADLEEILKAIKETPKATDWAEAGQMLRISDEVAELKRVVLNTQD